MSGIQHLVLFRFPNELSAADEAEFFRRVRSWPAAIDVSFVRLRLGRDASGRARGYQFALLSEFESDAEMRRYQDHPTHQDFLSFIRQRDCEVLAFDYELSSSSVVVEE